MVGSELKAGREKQGLTIQDAERETSIRASYLEALEDGQYAALPSEVYVKGFIRNYAAFLRLDGERLVREYRAEVHGADATPAPAATPATTSIVNERAPFSSGSDFHERVEKSHRAQIVFALVAAVVLVFVGSIYYFFGEDPAAVKPPQDAAQVAEQTRQPQSEAPDDQPATQTPAPEPMIGNTANAATGQSDVTVKLTDRCWMQVIADGKTVYENVAMANETMRWTGKDSVIIIAGNAGAVDVTYNGRRIGQLGKAGDVVEKRFSQGKVEDVK